MALSHRQIVGRNIRIYRKLSRMTQEKLAERADLAYKYLGEVERGSVNISLDSLMRITKALKVRLRDLIAGL